MVCWCVSSCFLHFSPSHRHQSRTSAQMSNLNVSLRLCVYFYTFIIFHSFAVIVYYALKYQTCSFFFHSVVFAFTFRCLYSYPAASSSEHQLKTSMWFADPASFILVDAHQRDLRSVIDSHSPVERHGWWWKILKLRGIIRDIFLCRDTKCLTDLVYLPERLCLKLLPPRSAIIYSAWLICQKHKFLESMNSS